MVLSVPSSVCLLMDKNAISRVTLTDQCWHITCSHSWANMFSFQPIGKECQIRPGLQKVFHHKLAWCYVRGKCFLFFHKIWPKILQTVTCKSNVSSQDWRDYLSPHLSPPPCISGEQLTWDPLLLCQVTSSQRRQLAITHANKSRPSPNASAGSHSHPDNISIPPSPTRIDMEQPQI